MGVKEAGVTGRGLLAGLMTVGFVAAFAGVRVVDGTVWLAVPVTLLGVAAVGVATGWQLFRRRGAEGDRRKVESVFAWSYLGCGLALVGLLLGTEAVVDWLGIEFSSPRTRVRYDQGVLTVSSALLAVSAVTVVAAEWAARRSGGRAVSSVDVLRVRETASNASSVAVAGIALMLLGYVASARNRTIDASYFKTSEPGEAVQAIARNLGSPLRVALFFPPVNAVKDEVHTYFRELQASVGDVSIEEYDRFADPDAATDFDVREDGTVVLRLGGQSERIGLPTDLNDARGRLRVLDSHVQQALLRLSRERRYAYMTTGHGELNGSSRAQASGAGDSADPVGALRRMLELLNYEVRDIGLQRGLGERIPDDAAMVLVLGPERPFLEHEAQALTEYMDRGGSTLFALEPTTEFDVEWLREELGVDVELAMTVDDQRHLRETGGVADRRLIVTNRISSHPSVATAGRQGPGSGILMIGPAQVSVLERDDGAARSLTVRSMPTSFVDLNADFRFDDETESRSESGLVAAVEAGPGDGDRLRALVFGDAELFTDAVLASLGVNAALVADGLRWLGREEDTAGEVVSEEDVPLVHTRGEDVAWFYAIIFGAPVLVLVAGLVSSLRRRRSRAAEAGA